MKMQNVKILVQNIVKQAYALKEKHVDIDNTPVNYACIFSHSEAEYQDLLNTARRLSKVIKETPTGLLFHIKPLDTIAGPLKLLKIRKPDITRPEQGDADFTVDNFEEFEKECLAKPGFKKIERPNFYMIELVDPDFDVRTYFSNPPLDVQLGIK